MKNIAAVLLLLAGLGGVRAEAALLGAVQTTNGTGFTWRLIIGANQSATIGWSFEVGSQNVELDALGLYDDGGDGLQDAHAVGIWSNGGTLLGQATVPSGTSGTLVGGYRYTSVTPLTLLAGQSYTIGAYFGPVADRCDTACGDASLSFGTETYAPGITFLQSRQNRAIIGSGSLAEPDLFAEIDEGFFGPNFLLNLPDSGVPEPSTLALAALGLAGVCLAGRFRRRA